MSALCRFCEEQLLANAIAEDVDRSVPCAHTARVGSSVQQNYPLKQLLSVDAISAVYQSSDAVGGDLLAIVLDPGLGPVDLAGVAAFQRFGREVLSVRHRNIAQAVAFGVEDDGSAVTLVRQPKGRSLRALLAEGPQTNELVSALAVQLFDALAEAHSHGVFHANLSPDRVWVATDGGQPELSVLGFGLAPVGAGHAGPAQPAHMIAVGAPRYMSPEQARGRSVVGHADIYGAAVVLYELLAGVAPFEERSAADYIVAHLQTTPKPPQRGDLPVSGVLVDCLMKCLSKKAWDRPNGAAVAAEWVALHAVPPLAPGGEVVPLSKQNKSPLSAIQARRGQRPTRFAMRVGVPTAG